MHGTDEETQRPTDIHLQNFRAKGTFRRLSSLLILHVEDRKICFIMCRNNCTDIIYKYTYLRVHSQNFLLRELRGQKVSRTCSRSSAPHFADRKTETHKRGRTCPRPLRSLIQPG